MTENEKNNAIRNVMIDVLDNGPLNVLVFRERCFEAFNREWGGGASEITVEFAKIKFGFLRTQPPFERDPDNGLIRISGSIHAAARGMVLANAAETPFPSSILAEAVESGRAATKVDIVNTIYDKLHERLSKKDIASVLDELTNLMAEHLVPQPKGPGKFTIPGLCAIEVESKEADAQPVVIVRPFKRLKDAIK